MANAALLKRLQRELQMLDREPPPGISAWPKDGNKITEIEACIIGAAETPYESGVFKLDITVPERYPYEPPNVRFVTPIYHPNIDDSGRICLDTLVQPPKGAWTPSLNISTVLSTIQVLMSHPNPTDPLMADINEVFVNNHARFVETAKQWTQRYANESENTSLAARTRKRDEIEGSSSSSSSTDGKKPEVAEPPKKRQRNDDDADKEDEKKEKKSQKEEGNNDDEDDEEEPEDEDEDDEEESENED